MKFEDIPAPSFSLRVKPKNPQAALPEEDVLSVELTRIREEFKVYTQEKSYTVTPTNPADVNQLSSILSSGRTFLAKLSNPAPNGTDGSAELNFALFYDDRLEMGNIDIGIDEKVLSSPALKNLESDKDNRYSTRSGRDPIEKAAIALFDNCSLKHGNKHYFFILAGNAAKEDLEGNASSLDDSIKENNSDVAAKPEINDVEEQFDSNYDEINYDEIDNKSKEKSVDNNRNFAILGSEIRFALSEKEKGNGETVFLASRITRLNSNYKDPALRLACGNLRFTDWTKAGERALLAKSQLDVLTKSENSYLSKWDEFGIIEGELFFEKVRKLGCVSFTVKKENKEEEKKKEQKKGPTVVIKCNNLNREQKDILKNEKRFDFVDIEHVPVFLENPDMTFSEYINNFAPKDINEQILTGEDNDNKNNQSENDKSISLTKDEFDYNTSELILNAESAPSEKYFLIYPIAGDMAQIKRRLEARNNIQNGRSANPNLGLLIEDAKRIPPTQRPPKIPAMSDFVKQKVFPHEPTMMQLKAVDVALNTPDIALIQGPPGTGKTTVIAAIIERLNQLADKRAKISGRVLLTGFQHDAVENMIGRLKLNGLPVPKFGQRPGEDLNEGLSIFEQELQDWLQKTTDNLRKENPQISASLEENNLRNLCVQYIKAPTLELAMNVLTKALEQPAGTLSVSLRMRLQNELVNVKRELDGNQTDHSYLPFIRALRTTEKSFADDGSLRAADVLYTLGDDLDETDKDLLERASKWYKKETPPFINELKELKRKLMILYTPAPAFRIEKPRDAVLDLIKETIIAIRHNGLKIKDKKTAALAELLLEMENNPEGMLESIKDYCFAFAATCQQSVNKKMQKMKGIMSDSASQSSERLEYDFVIVDEAARVSPMDLMISMAQGRRIILVGDHRQLPQLIDDDVVERMLEESDKNPESQNGSTFSKDIENEWLKKSMFEYLFTERLPALEKMDGIQRRVTLDAQYRMHPTLGAFISHNFYERYNPEEKFKSGLSESYFKHNLPGTDGKCAIWINVPFRKNSGEMSRDDTSWIRSAEADVICKKLNEWIEFDNSRPDEPKLKFGVISFYKGQTELIKKRMAEKFSKYIENGHLRIGTVDAFQGMEFDVVFLSLVRTMDIKHLKPGQNPFGFLQVYNRLNVSMSRQKRLLVVVGDAPLFATNAAKDIVPGLYEFQKLCREKGRML